MIRIGSRSRHVSPRPGSMADCRVDRPLHDRPCRKHSGVLVSERVECSHDHYNRAIKSPCWSNTTLITSDRQSLRGRTRLQGLRCNRSRFPRRGGLSHGAVSCSGGDDFDKMREFRNPALHAAFSSYARVALALISKSLDGGGEVPTLHEAVWADRPNALIRQEGA